MDERDAPQSASAEEEARIGEVPAVFANKVYVSPMPIDRSFCPCRAGLHRSLSLARALRSSPSP